jgi:hypothetical protein
MAITGEVRMTNLPKKKQKKEEPGVPQMPFDEALKLVWKSPPRPHVAKKKLPGKKNYKK